jgi:hypothetical protein
MKMATAPLSPVEVMRSAGRDSSALSPVEKTAFEFCRRRAAEGKPVNQLDITLAIGSQNFTGGTAAGVLARLERKGLITRMFYQRGLQVCIAETGECTAPPACRATHWRLREQDVQTPPLHRVRERSPILARVIEDEARKAGKAIPDFLMDLVANGLELYLEQVEEER